MDLWSNPAETKLYIRTGTTHTRNVLVQGACVELNQAVFQQTHKHVVFCTVFSHCDRASLPTHLFKLCWHSLTRHGVFGKDQRFTCICDQAALCLCAVILTLKVTVVVSNLHALVSDENVGSALAARALDETGFLYQVTSQTPDDFWLPRGRLGLGTGVGHDIRHDRDVPAELCRNPNAYTPKYSHFSSTKFQKVYHHQILTVYHHLHYISSKRSVGLKMVNTPLSDAVISQHMREKQTAALHAMNRGDHAQATLFAESARSDSKLLYHNFLIQNNISSETGVPFRDDTHKQLDKELALECVKCTHALFEAIQSHALGHATALLAAQVAATEKKQTAGNDQNARNRENAAFERAFHFPDYDEECALALAMATHSRLGALSSAQTLTEDVVRILTVKNDAKSADTLMWEAIFHYESYHVHTKTYDSALYRIMSARRDRCLCYKSMTREHLMEKITTFAATVKLRPDFLPSINDDRGDARGAHAQRIQYFSRARQHVYDLAVREWLPMLAKQFTPEHLARFSATSNLFHVEILSQAEYYNKTPTRLNAITIALNSLVLHDAFQHYEDSKQALERRNYRMCKTSARRAMHAFELLIYIASVQKKIGIFVWHSRNLHFTKMILCLNDELELAHSEVVQAQKAVDQGEPMTVNLFTNKATSHWDRHDGLLLILNAMLLEEYDNSVDEHIPHAFNPPAWYVERSMLPIERQYGPVANTVRERAMLEDMVREGTTNKSLHACSLKG